MCSLFTLRLPPSYFPVELNGFEAFVAWCNSTTYVRVELHPTKPEAFCLRSRGWRLPRVSRKLQFIDWRSSVVQDDSKNWPWRIFVFIACNRFPLPRGFFFASGFPFGIALHEGVGILVSSRRSISKDGIGVGPRALHTLNVYNRVCTLALAIRKTSMSQLFGLFNQAYRKNPQPTNVLTLAQEQGQKVPHLDCILLPVPLHPCGDS